MRRPPTFAALVAMVLELGCAANRRRVQVKLEVQGGPMVLHVPESSGRPVEIPEVELWGAFREAGRDVVAQVDPLAAAERTFERGGAERGVYRYYTRSKLLVAESLDGGLADWRWRTPIERLTRGYVEWCAGTRMGQLAGSDCLGLLGHSRRADAARAVRGDAGDGADGRPSSPMLDSLGELANPAAIAATLASAVAMYLLLWLLPEPISKVIATSITVFLIGYVGLDLFFSLVGGVGGAGEGGGRGPPTSATSGEAAQGLRQGARAAGGPGAPPAGEPLSREGTGGEGAATSALRRGERPGDEPPPRSPGRSPPG